MLRSLDARPRPASRLCVLALVLCVCALTLFLSLLEAPELTEVDFVVVGGGSTGSVVAGRLGAAGYSVLVLEAGGGTQRTLNGGAEPVAGRWTIFDLPLGWVQVLSDHRWATEFQWDIPADPPPAQARGLGGCGVHNAMLYMRGRPEDFAAWGEGWSWRDVLPFYLRSENNQQLRADELHGTSGPVHVTTVDSDNISRAFVEAGTAAGLHRNDDFNGARRSGVGFYQFMIRDGVRDSAAAAYIGRRTKPPSVTVRTHALVTRVLFDDQRRATGVELVRGRNPTNYAPRTRVRARREVILAAGAVHTPKLLLLSGIGDRAQLEPLGIDVVQHSPYVGRGLADGVYAIMQWTTRGNDFVRCRLDPSRRDDARLADEDEDEDGGGGDDDDDDYGGGAAGVDDGGGARAGGGGDASSPGRSPAAAAVAEQLQRHCADQRARLLRGEPSVFASPGLSVGAFLRSPHATGDEPDVQVTVHPWDKYSRVWASPLFSIATVEIANNQPNSRGRVALRTAVPTDPPLFDGPYLHDINDSRALRWAMREVRRIVRTPPLDKHIVEELVPGEHRQSEGELLDAIACGPQQTRDSGRAECDRSELPVNHLAGTCRLGPSIEAQAVVDLRLRVHGVRRLRVADASVMPRPPCGNTHATCMMIGERAAQFIIDEHGASRKVKQR